MGTPDSCCLIFSMNPSRMVLQPTKNASRVDTWQVGQWGCCLVHPKESGQGIMRAFCLRSCPYPDPLHSDDKARPCQSSSVLAEIEPSIRPRHHITRLSCWTIGGLIIVRIVVFAMRQRRTPMPMPPRFAEFHLSRRIMLHASTSLHRKSHSQVDS